MLSVVDRNGRPVRPLGADEVEAMLAAFARPGATALARTRRAEIVRKVQQRNGWFRCGCLDGTEPAPVLVPVLESHIRRIRPARAADQVDCLRLAAGLRVHALASAATSSARASTSTALGSKVSLAHSFISAWLSCAGSAMASRNSA